MNGVLIKGAHSYIFLYVEITRFCFFSYGKERCWCFRFCSSVYMIKNFPLKRSGVRLRNVLYQLTVFWYVCTNSTIIAGNIMNITAKHYTSYVPFYFLAVGCYIRNFKNLHDLYVRFALMFCNFLFIN